MLMEVLRQSSATSGSKSSKFQRQITKDNYFFWFPFWLFSCVHVTADCYRDNGHWLLTRVQGGCLEPKWQWPFWHSAAHPQTNSCVHPNGGVVGDCGSADLSDINKNRGFGKLFFEKKHMRHETAIFVPKNPNPEIPVIIFFAYFLLFQQQNTNIC